jgi:hypothetical protein
MESLFDQIGAEINTAKPPRQRQPPPADTDGDAGGVAGETTGVYGRV